MALSLFAVAMVGMSIRRVADSVMVALGRADYAMTYTGGALTWLSTHPEFLYHPLDTAPFVPTIYPPAYPLLVASLQTATGLPVPLLQRALGIVAILGTGYLLARIIHQTTRQPWAGLVAGGLYALSPAILQPNTLARVDHLAMLGFAAALFWFITVDGDRRLRYVTLGLSAAVLSKHTYGLLGLVFLGALWLDEREARRDASRLLAYSTVVGIVVGAALLVWTDGRILTHLITVNAASPLYLTRFVDQVSWLLLTHVPLLIMGAVVVYYWRPEAPPTDISLAIPFTVLGGAILYIGTIGRAGSWVGYAYPLLAGCALGGGYLAARVIDDNPLASMQLYPTRTLSIALVLLLATQGLLFNAWVSSPALDADAQQQAVEYIDGADDPVLVEDLSLVSRGEHQRAAYEPLVMKYAIRNGAWPDRVADRIRHQRYEYIVTWQPIGAAAYREGRWTEKQVEAITEEYAAVDRFGGYYVYARAEDGN